MEETNKKKCFIITPMDKEGSEIRKKAEGVISAVIEPILKNHEYEIYNPIKLSSSGSITNQIISHIMHDDLVIANLTGQNPNVIYELAVRHAMLKPVICICEKNTELPFDLVGDRVIPFDDNMASVSSTMDQLNDAIKDIKDNEGSDNPIHRAIQNSFFQIQNEKINQMAKKIEGEEGDALKLVLDKLTLLEENYTQNNRTHKDRIVCYDVPIDIEIGKLKTTQYVTIDERYSVQKILDQIFFLIQEEVHPYEYMKSWILKEETLNIYLMMNAITEIIPSNCVFRQDFKWKVIKWNNGRGMSRSYDKDSGNDRDIIQQHW